MTAHDDKFLIVDYSPKSITIPGDFDCVLRDEFAAIGGRFNPRLKHGPGWVFSKKTHLEQLTRLFTAYEINSLSVSLTDMDCTSTIKHNGQAQSSTIPEYITTDKQGVIVTLTDGSTLMIARDGLITEFSFGYSDFGQGPSSDECHAAADHAKTDEQYFIDKNLERIRGQIELLRGYDRGHYPWLIRNQAENTWSVYTCNIDSDTINARDYLDAWERVRYDSGDLKPLSNADRERLIAAYNHALELREKRCQKYLDRYGLSKIRINTYWMDR